MEHDICMICSNNLSEEEKLFHPCDCSFKYCFYCFKDLFERLSGSRQGKCPQCTKPLVARILVPKQKSQSIPTDKSKLRNIRIINRESIYIKHIPCALTVETLRSPDFCGKYGEIKNISPDLKYFKEDPTETYRIFLHYSSQISAAKALIALNGLKFSNSTLKAEYMISNFCGNFLKNRNCPNRSCKFLHEIPNNSDWFYFGDLTKTELSKPKNVEKFEIIETKGFPSVQLVFKVSQEIMIPKRSLKYTPKYIPVSNINFKVEPQQKSDSEVMRASVKDYNESIKEKKTRGGVFALLSEED